MNEADCLIYNEDDTIRKFSSSSFNFIFDKEIGSSFSWGKTKDESPLYNPISPEEIEIILNDDYIFNENEITKFLNLNIENYITSTTISCITSINITTNKANEIEVKKLINYLNNFKIIVFLNLKYTNKFSLRDIFKIKLFGVNNIFLTFENDLSNFEDSINKLIENDFFVKCRFNINDNNIEKIVNILNNEKYSKEMYTLINFQKSLKKKNFANLINVLKTKNEYLMFIERNNSNKYIKYDVCSNEYRPGLDSCVIDFITKTIYPSIENIENFVNINDINNISNYWNSKEFEKFRKPIVNKLKRMIDKNDNLENEQDVTNE
jgi:hypothetical protein